MSIFKLGTECLCFDISDIDVVRTLIWHEIFFLSTLSCDSHPTPSIRLSSTYIIHHLSTHATLNDNRPILSSDEINLSRLDRSVVHSRSMSPCHHSVNRQVLVEVWQYLLRTGGVAPVPHQITYDGEERDKLNTCGLHTRICCVAHELRVSTTGFDVGKNRVAFCAEGKGEEGGADVCSDASDDDLGFVCRADSGLEISVVPGAGDVLAECAAMDVFSSGWVIRGGERSRNDLLDLALTSNERRIGIHLQHLLGQRTVGTLVRRRT